MSFVDNLKRAVRSLKNIGPNDMHIFTINANYGHYQIIVRGRQANKTNLEINGEIHHLFVSPNGISPNPSRQEIHENLKNTVIMRDLSVHICDDNGNGKKVVIKKSDVHPRECINLAGKDGEKMLKNAETHGRLEQAAYHIIQEDILHSLNKEDS